MGFLPVFAAVNGAASWWHFVPTALGAYEADQPRTQGLARRKCLVNIHSKYSHMPCIICFLPSTVVCRPTVRVFGFFISVESVSVLDFQTPHCSLASERVPTRARLQMTSSLFLPK